MCQTMTQNTVFLEHQIYASQKKITQPLVARVETFRMSGLILCENIFTARHTHIVRDGALNHKVDFLTFLQILNLEGHPSHITGLKVTVFLLESVQQRVMITPHIDTAEIVT